MQVQTEEVGGIRVIRVPEGHLDANSSKEFKTLAMPFLLNTEHVIIDLRDVTFVDSSGFGVLLACLRQVQSNGGELGLCGLHKSVRVLFEVVRMNRLFSIYESADDAIRSFALLNTPAAGN